MTLKIDSKHLSSLATINRVSSIKRNFTNCLSTAFPSTCSLSLFYAITLKSKNMPWSKDSCLDLWEVLSYSEVRRGSFTSRGTFHLKRGKKSLFWWRTSLSPEAKENAFLRWRKKLIQEYSGHCQWVWKISYFDTYRSINWKKLKLALTLGRDTAHLLQLS